MSSRAKSGRNHKGGKLTCKRQSPQAPVSPPASVSTEPVETTPLRLTIPDTPLRRAIRDVLAGEGIGGDTGALVPARSALEEKTALALMALPKADRAVGEQFGAIVASRVGNSWQRTVNPAEPGIARLQLPSESLPPLP